MKFFNVLFIAALISAGTTAVAKEDPRNVRLAVVPVKGSEVFKVIYKNESASKVKLSLYNSSRELVFSETITGSEGFIRPLNFSGLRSGEYTIEITEGTEKRTEKFIYTPEKNVAAATERKVASNIVVHIAKVSEPENKFLVSIVNAVNEKVTVRIYDNNDTLLFTETHEVSGDFAQVYRVKNSDGVRFEIYDAAGLSKLSRF